jgi:hypothetical protein
MCENQQMHQLFIQFAFKHGPDPPTAGLLKSMLSSGLDNGMKRGIVECFLNIQ